LFEGIASEELLTRGTSDGIEVTAAGFVTANLAQAFRLISEVIVFNEVHYGKWLLLFDKEIMAYIL
jgi:hypothetical protein